MKWSFKYLMLFFMLGLGYNLSAQVTINTCSATFYDAGGGAGNYDVLSAGSYAGNGDLIVTYCSTAPNLGIRAIFSEFTIKQVDTMFVYDGPNTSSPLIGKFTGVTNILSSFYSSGQCLTFEFVSLATVSNTSTRPLNSNGDAVGANGWTANITCTNLPSSSGVEICGNGIDDDLDGLIDEQDSDCVGVLEDPLSLDCEEALSYYFPPVWRMLPAGGSVPHDSVLYNGPITLTVSTLFPTANFTLSNLNGFTQSFSVNAGNVQTIPISYLSGLMQTNVINTIETGKGLLITSDVPIFINYRNDSQNNKLIMTGKNSEGVGKSFFVASQTNVRVQTPMTTSLQEAHFVSVMATEDQTNISFNFNNAISDGTVSGQLNSPINIVLDRGETYLIRDPFLNTTVSGLLVKSDKNIGVVSGSMHSSQLKRSNLASEGAIKDGGADVLIPVKNLGTDHVIVSALEFPSQEYAIVVATEDSTEVFIDGNITPIVTLNQGQFFQYKPNKMMVGEATYIRTSLPAYIYAVSGLSTQEVDMGLAGSINECRGSTKISFSKFSGSNNQIQLVIPTTGLASLELNGAPFAPMTVNAVPGFPGYSAVTITNAELPLATNTIESDARFTASQIVGSSTGGAFGYLTSFTSKIFAKDPETGLATNFIKLDPICNADSFVQSLTFEGCGNNIKLKAYKPGQFTQSINFHMDSISFTYLPLPNTVGMDTITLSFSNDEGVQGAVCIVFVLSKPTAVININGQDTVSVCGNFNTTLTPNVTGGITPYTYLWNTGATSPTINITALGDTTFSVIVTDSVGCTDTAYIRIIADTQAPTITCPADQTVNCANLVPAPNIALVMSSDPEGGPSNVSFVKDSITNVTCANRYIIHRVYSATDTCGNVSRCIQRITVDDQIAPVISSIPANTTVSCAGQVPATNVGAVVASDNCSETPVITVMSDVISNQTCANRYTITRTYVATDACGNSSTQSQIITVNDQTPPIISSIPANITVSCASAVPATNIGAVVASDNCGETPIISVNADQISNQTCPNRYTITRTYVATDACGNTSTQSQIITVNDQTSPTITFIPVNITVSCADAVPVSNVGAVTATDNCGEVPMITVLPDQISNQTCPNRYTVTRTYIATDACGNTSSQSQIITVNDQTPPTITFVPANITVSCVADVPPTNIAGVTATDNCGGVPGITVLNDVISNQTCANRYTLTRSYVATDACGNTSSMSQIITVYDDTAPTPPMMPSGVSYPCIEDTLAGPSLIATDNCAAAMVPGIYSVSLDTLNPGGPNPGSPSNPIYIVRKWTFTDVCSNVSMLTVVDTINNTSMPQVPMPPADTLVMCVTDTLPAPTLILSNGCGLTSVGQLSVEFIENGCSDTIIRTWTFDRSPVSLPDTSVTQTIVVMDTVKPTLPAVMLPDTQIIYGCGVNYLIQNQQIDLPQATDNCSMVSVTKTRIFPNIQGPGCLIDPLNPGSLATGNMPFQVLEKWVFTDACGNSDSIQTRYFFYDTIPPKIVSRADLDLTCKSEIPPATRLNNAEIMENCLPGSPILQNTVTTIIEGGDGSSSSPYIVLRVYTVRDNCFTVTDTQRISVVDSIPPVPSTTPSPLFVSCVQDTMTAPVVTATDNCGIDSTFYGVTSNMAPGCGTDTLKLTRTWEFFDTAGNVATVVQIVNVIDNVPPTLVTNVPADTTIQCFPLPVPFPLLGTDNCSMAPIIATSRDSLVVGTQCTDSQGQRWIRIYTLKDQCGNVSEQSQNIYVKDTIAPVLAGAMPEDQILSCPADTVEYSAPILTATDNCSGSVNPVFSSTTSGKGCVGDTLVVMRTWIFTDACNNATVIQQKLKVVDDIAPVIINLNGVDTSDVVVGCEVPPAVSLTANDNCIGDITVNAVDVNVPGGSGTVEDPYIVNRIWTFVDSCGNTLVVTKQISIADNIAPMAPADFPDTLVMCFGDIPPQMPLSASDECGGSNMVNPVDMISKVRDCEYEVIRRWIFTDAVGNADTTTWMITVRDTVPPVFSGTVSDTLVMCLADVPPVPALTATDNCSSTPIPATVMVDISNNSGCVGDTMYITRTFTFTDSCGNSTSKTQIVSVADTTTPQFTVTSPDTLVTCFDLVPPATSVQAIGACGAIDPMNIQLTEVVDSMGRLGCVNDTIYVRRTYVATNACLTSATFVQTIFVVDTVPPMSLMCNDITINVDDSGNATSTPPIEDIVATYSDCNIVDFTSNLSAFDCSVITQGATFQIIVTDICGNESICEPAAIIQDGLAPTFVQCPGDMVIQLPLGQCDTLINFTLEAIDNCGDPVIDSLHSPGLGRGLPFPIGVHKMFYTATDISGNMDTCMFTVTVLAPNGKADLSCLEQLNYSVTEDCEIYLTADMFLTGNGYACADLYIVCVYLDEAKTIMIPNDTILDRTFLGKKIIYEIKDTANGNSCWGYLLLEDKLPPVIVGGSDTLMCGDSYDPEVLGFPSPDTVVVVKKVTDTYYIVDSLDNCTLVDLYLKDSIVSLGCQFEFAQIIYRKWTAIDGFGRESIAYDTIYFKRPTLADVVPPEHYDGINNPALSCDGDWARFANGAPDTTVTGVPLVAGCFNIRYTFEDQIIPVCEDGSCRKIIRKWIIFDWCTGEFRYIDQLIKIEDTEAPVIEINAGKDTLVEIAGTECFGTYKIPVPTVTDNCSDLHGEYKVWANSGNLIKIGDDLFLNDLIEGYHTIYFSATDCCGNIGTDSLRILVIDNNPPVAIAKEYITLSLTNNEELIKDGTAKLYPYHIDNGSFDNCNEVYLEIRRDDESGACRNLGVNGYNNNLTYNNDGHEHDNVADTDSGRYVKFCCEDVGKEVKVWLRVWDDANHSGIFGDEVNGISDKYNETWSIVKVEDKTAPILVPPTDMTVSCYYIYDKDDLGKYFGRVYTDRTEREAIYGDEPICSDDRLFDEENPFETYNTLIGYSGFAIDACDVTVTETSKIEKLCDEYLITRTFVATDLQGLSTRAVQTIRIVPCVEFFITDEDCENDNPNDGVIWPCDYEITSCDAQTDTSVTGRPIIDPRFCESIGINYSDWIWGDKREGCYKIERVWRLMKYCGSETWEYHQWIDVKNGEKPTILNCTDLEICADDETCIGQVTYTLKAEDDCTAEAYLYYSYEIDLNSDGTIDYAGTGNKYDRSFPRGNHLVIWTVRDICGNVAQCDQKVNVKDCKDPIAYCYQQLVTSIPKGGEDRWLWASDFDKGSYDNCGEPVELSFSTNVLDDSLLINCDLMITYPETKIRVDLYVTDKSGNVETCPTFLTIIDPTNYCIENQGKAIVSGDVRTTTNFPVNKYDISISSSSMNKSYSSTDMKYKFDKLPMYDDYLVAPIKKDEVRAGVNTLDLLHIQRHILRLKDLNDPLKVIAADANNDQKVSVNDLVDIRKVILEVYNTFPRTNSWRFVRRGVAFPDAKNPWPFEEVISLENLSKNEVVNYTAIKVGDVNDSYVSGFADSQIKERSEPLRLLQRARTDGQGNQVIDLYPETSTTLSGFQFSLAIAGLSEQPSLVENTLVTRDAVHIVGNEVLVSWFDQQGNVFGPENAMITLRTKTGDQGSVSLTNRLEAEAYDSNLEERSLELGVQDLSKRAFVSQVNPNPFVDQTSFTMQLPQASEVKLKIFDSTGQLILSRTSPYQAGDHEVTINGQSLPAGAYSYQVVINDNEVFTHRFIKIR